MGQVFTVDKEFGSDIDQISVVPGCGHYIHSAWDGKALCYLDNKQKAWQIRWDADRNRFVLGHYEEEKPKMYYLKIPFGRVVFRSNVPLTEKEASRYEEAFRSGESWSTTREEAP